MRKVRFGSVGFLGLLTPADRFGKPPPVFCADHNFLKPFPARRVMLLPSTQPESSNMKKLLLILPVAALSLSACATTDQNAAAGALGGAALGAALSSDDDRTQGALIGAAVGVAGSTLIGPAQQAGQCYYRDAYGRRVVGAC
ncbi:MAG: glycine zipper 2TM domain-containing protein [Paracoccaceae bacterium]